MRDSVFWGICIVALVGIVVLFGLAYDEWKGQEPLTSPYVQEDFTVPMHDKSDSEFAVLGPESVIEEA